jgi:hypothetical protein
MDMRAAGRFGGRGRARSMLGISDELADTNLREHCRARLEMLVNSDNEQVALRAATAPFSYRAAAAAADAANWHDAAGHALPGTASLSRSQASSRSPSSTPSACSTTSSRA